MSLLLQLQPRPRQPEPLASTPALRCRAGEEGGPELVWQAIRKLKVQRVDHGIHATEDPELVEYMEEHQLPITLCPISNLLLQVG